MPKVCKGSWPNSRLSLTNEHWKEALNILNLSKSSLFRFIRERSELEKEYAKCLRGLLAKFSPKENKMNTGKKP
jgi:hypothetical protein